MASVRGARRIGVRKSSRAPDVEEIVPNSGWTEDSAAHYLLVDLPGFKKEEVKLQVDGSSRIITKGERQENEDKRIQFELTFPAPVNSEIENISGKFDGEILHVIVPKRIAREKQEGETEKASENVAARAEDENKHDEQSSKDEIKDETKQEQQTEMEERTEGIREERREGIREKDEDESHRNGRTKFINYIGSFPKELIRKWEQEPGIIKNAVEVLSKNKKIIVTAVLAFSLGVYVSRRLQS